MRLLNYKEVYGNKDNEDDNSSSDEDNNDKKNTIMKMQLVWRGETQFGNYGGFVKGEM